MKIYCKSENCVIKGSLAVVMEECDDDPYENHGDYFLWGEGEKEELIENAIESLGTRYDTRPGGAGDSFRWKCDLNVLDFLDGPEMRFDSRFMYYMPIPDCGPCEVCGGTGVCETELYEGLVNCHRCKEDYDE